MRWAIVASGSRKARAISSVVRPQIILQRQRRASLARQARMAGGEDQPQQFVADIVVERRIRIGHGLLLLLQIAYQHLVLAREHVAAAQMIERAAFGGGHQPRAGLFRHAGSRPMFERRQQRFLRQVFGQRHVAQHPGQARDQPRLFDCARPRE